MNKVQLEAQIQKLDKEVIEYTNGGGTSMSKIQQLCEKIEALQTKLKNL